MKKWPIVLLAVVLVAGGLAYAKRGTLRDAWAAMHSPVLPAATRVLPAPARVTDAGSDLNSPVEGGMATSEHYVLESSPMTNAPQVDPLAVHGPLPDQINLDVPFTIQAPKQDWSGPFEDTCEEASVLMVNDYYKGASGIIPPDQAQSDILALVDYENKAFGDYRDTTAAQTALMAKDFFKLDDAKVVPVQSTDDIKRLLANGYPVIVPAAGRELGNPYFSGAGPVYHMYVVKGYTKDGQFITNDPGTRHGKDYLYPAQTVMSSMHDYVAANIDSGAKVVIVLVPAQP